jgi:2,4-dienoyl-CoA reductase-like NADH-dependent reductase (Old Yellow Enzyme family)
LTYSVNTTISKKVSSQLEAILDPLLRDIEKFLKARDITPTRFGRETIRDPQLVFRMRQGRELRRETEKRIRDWMLVN